MVGAGLGGADSTGGSRAGPGSACLCSGASLGGTCLALCDTRGSGVGSGGVVLVGCAPGGAGLSGAGLGGGPSGTGPGG